MPITLALGTLAAGAVAAGPFHAGSLGPFLLFHAASALMVVAAYRSPVEYGFSALTIFLLLGFWLKIVATAFGLPVLIEPVGDFTGSVADWDRALTVTAVGLTGVALTKLIWSGLTSRQAEQEDLSVPAWYGDHRRFVWTATAAAIVAGNVANWAHRFYMVGVNERTVLPFHLNVAVVWWLTAGAGMWLATLLEWERRRGGRKLPGRWLLIPIAEALITTVVMLSRGFYLMKVMPYALAVLHPAGRRRLGLRPRTLAVIGVIAAAGFVVSLAGVAWLRIETYPALQLPQVARSAGQAADGSDELSPARVRVAVNELGRMVVGRWIGLEGVLAVSAAPVRTLALLKTAVAEDPGSGNAAIFQQMSRSKYQPLADFTFLTVPGVIAVFFYSGSYSVVLLGMSLATVLVLATEATCRYWLRNDLLCAVIGVAMANALVQMNFPYLTAVFFLEVWVTLVGLRILRGVGMRQVRRAEPGMSHA